MPQSQQGLGTDVREASPPCAFSGATVSNWFALRLRSNFDFHVETALRGRGMQVYLPTWRESVRWSDRQKTIDRPLFPGYIFVRAQRDKLIEALRLTGVVQALPTSLGPTPIPDDQIANVRRVIETDNFASPCPYVAGEAVTIESGPLAGVSGVVVRTEGHDSIVVGVEMLGRAVRVRLDASELPKKV
jgi:transcription termination/antitermination protein NusG